MDVYIGYTIAGYGGLVGDVQEILHLLCDLAGATLYLLLVRG